MAIIGIDLGTTNSACCVWKGTELIQIPNRLNKFLTPSVVTIDDGNNIIVGTTAKQRLISHPNNTVAVFKRIMGTEHSIEIGDHSFTAPELSSFILRSLIEDAEAFLSEKVTEAIISVPAYFNENQRYATKLAGELAGLNVRRLINEPTAAAMAYSLNDRQQGTFMILDMGGGTFDVSILEYFEGVMEVHASAGDNYLGGEDFVSAMFEQLCFDNNFDKEQFSREERQQAFMKLEIIKCTIDKNLVHQFQLTYQNERYNLTIEQNWFYRVINPLLIRVQHPINQALRDANLPPNEIDDIILVGGSTKLKALRSMVSKLFGRLPSCNLDPDLVVSIGAGVQAGLVEKNAALDDIVLTDVCPFTLGTEILDDFDNPGQMLPIIERNSIVPISVERDLYTSKDYQTAMRIDIYQGEHRQVNKNICLGELNISVPKDKVGKQPVTVRYSYDMSGLLEVDVKVKSTGKAYNKVIHNAPGALTDEQISRAKETLKKLKFHPRDSEKNRALVARAERIYSSSLGSQREDVGQLISRFEHILDNQNPREIQQAQVVFSEALDSFDSESWF
ncbi:molecular chaperone HscC [Pseudoalteromonas sp. NEC-BIFX-2020_015]|uniref:molecular chaperone HscC n=1 Tax=Pseudoalteromonas sp. NEC-BIFX-2020_015 TaxID=2729544 RepID=UPI0014613C94|nr:molecular chaperone HscC [Pseudoalteromonas sp. NEC-BIFX-2020_015]NMR26331.1 molecular chaperone HscC [Pseudoalteromonas sp. NEC-BIFX-2020_015]